MSPEPFTIRERVLAQLLRALMAGVLVRVGTRVFAQRERGETIDDGGDQVFEALNHMMFERFESHSYVDEKLVAAGHRWCGLDSAPRPLLRSALNELSDQDVELLHIGLTATAALSPQPLRDALHFGIRIAEPPTAVFG